MTPVIEARGLSYHYAGAGALSHHCGGHRLNALDCVDLAIGRGRRIALLGANGAGKSTLLLHLNGTLRPSQGHVLLDGQPATYDRDALRRWRQRVGLVFQDPDDQLFAATVFQDVSYGPLNLGLTAAQARLRATEALCLVEMEDLALSPPHMLSGGQRKRVAIAGILAMRPEVMVLDEPFSGLDPAGVDQMMTLFARLAAGGTTIVVAMHDVDKALAWADEVVVLAQGRVARRGEPHAVLGDADFMATARLRVPWVLEGLAALKPHFRPEGGRRLPSTRAEFMAMLAALTGPAASEATPSHCMDDADPWLPRV